jgi:hypothetical protein
MLLPRFSYFEQSCDARNTTVNTVKNTLQFYKKKKKRKKETPLRITNESELSEQS